MKFRDPSYSFSFLRKSSHPGARALALGVALLAGAPLTRAQSITYTKIADASTTAPGSASTFSSLSSVALDGSNLVFIGAFDNNGSAGIFTSTVSGLSLSKIVDYSTIPTDSGTPMSSPISSFQTPLISGGNLAFKATLANNASGIYSASVGTLGASLVAQANDAAPEAHEKFSSLFAPGISGTQVGFFSNFVDDGSGLGRSASGLYVGTAGQHATPSLLMDRPVTLNGHAITNFGNNASMDGNMVAFRANYSGGNALYAEKTDGTSLTLIADSSTQLPDHSGTFSLGLSTPVISGSNVAFSTVGGVYLSDATGIHTIADGNTFVPGLSGVKFLSNGFASSVSVDGENVAFTAAYDGGSGIFVEYDGNLLPIVTTSSNLFGDPVYFYSLSNEALDGNNLAFSYLVNGSSGTTGVAVANIANGVPEPSVWTSLLGGIGLFAMGRRARKRATTNR